METEIISALISAGATIVSAIFTMCSSFVVAVLVYLIFKLVLNKQEAKLDLKIEKAKAGLVPAQKDLYSGTLEYLHFLLEYLMTTKEIYLTIPLPKILDAFFLQKEGGRILIDELDLTNSQINEYLKFPPNSFKSLYKALVETPEVIEEFRSYQQVHKEKLSKLLIIPEIKSRGEDLCKRIFTFPSSINYLVFLESLESLFQTKGISVSDLNKIIEFNSLSMKELFSDYDEIEKRFNELYEIT